MEVKSEGNTVIWNKSYNVCKSVLWTFVDLKMFDCFTEIVFKVLSKPNEIKPLQTFKWEGILSCRDETV